MKKIYSLSISLLLFSQIFISQTNDIVSLLPSYANQSFYNLNSGEVANVDNNNWDIAFSAGGYGSAIRINGQSGTLLYTYPNGDINDWNSVDISAISSWSPINNSDTSWGVGAFNVNADPSNSMDLGWGIYSTITHHITGDSINIIKLSNGDYKKLQITKLSSGNYDFKYANIDGSNEVTTSISKSSFSGKNFGYYSIINDVEVDREPLSSDWQISFTKYITQLSPGVTYGVTGVLANNDIQVAKAENIDVANANHNSHNYSSKINTIGYNWKSFNMSSFSYEIQDSLCYFIKDDLDNIWKLQLTGFDGSSTGNIYFNVESIESANIFEHNDITFSIFPNPSINKEVSIIYDLKGNRNTNEILISDLNGKLIKSYSLKNTGFNANKLSLLDFKPGVYVVSLINGNSILNKKLIVQ
jgi:hypothetical protein